MRILLVHYIVAEKFVLGEFMMQLSLKEFGQLDLGFGHHGLIELHLRAALAVIHHGLFAGLMDKVHAESYQVLKIRSFCVGHSSS